MVILSSSKMSSRVFAVNTLRFSDAIWRHKSGSTLGKWLLLDGTKPLPEPMLTVRSSGNYLKAILQEVPRPSVTKISFIRCHVNHPGAWEMWYLLHDDLIKWKHFLALLALCVGNSPVTGEFPAQRPVIRSFGVFFDLHLNKRLSKQSRRWWFETPSRSLWRHCNGKRAIF